MNPTELILDWLADAPEIGDDIRANDALADAETLQQYLDKRIQKDGEARKLRDDLVKWATQNAPRDIGDLKGFLGWSLSEVDWQAVFGAVAPDHAPAVAETPLDPALLRLKRSVVAP